MLFKSNKYTSTYFRIVKNAQPRPKIGYTETHHIIPRCLGGSNDKSNLVELSAREHFICHILLTKMSDDTKLHYGVIMMTRNNPNQQRVYKITSRVYEKVKVFNSALMTAKMTGKPGVNAGRYRWYNPHTNEERVFKKGSQPTEWIRGRSPRFKQARSGAYRGHQFYHNPTTHQLIRLAPSCAIPIGFIKGNPNADKSRMAGIKGSSYYHDPITGEESRHKKEEGWVKGRSSVWITNGEINNRVNKITDPLPQGWKYGRDMTSIVNSRMKANI